MTDRYKTILLFGPPGSGKGTQGAMLGRIPGFIHMATGDIFRGLDPDSEIGKNVSLYSFKGELVPDDLTMQIWQNHVTKMIAEQTYRPDHELLVLDGMPRSVGQARAIDSLIEVLAIIELDTPDREDLVARMKRRAQEQSRNDDADESIIRNRFVVYDGETAPVLSHYECSLHHKVNALCTPGEVLLQVLSTVVPLQCNLFSNAPS